MPDPQADQTQIEVAALGEAYGKPVAPDLDLGELRALLVGREQEQLGQLEGDLEALRGLLADKEALAAVIAPSLDEALRNKIQQNRDEMIEAMYPIIGQSVVRAVSEAIQDLARNVDARVRTSLTPTAAVDRLQARLRGVSTSDTVLREALPCQVVKLFLIHRETGLLLRSLPEEDGQLADTELISSMLTAVRDFAQDAFGQGREGQLDAIQYGDLRILIEAAQHVVLAAVVDGVEPSGFRAAMREQVIEIEHRYRFFLRDYGGDASVFASTDEVLRPLLLNSQAPPAVGLSRTQKRLLAGMLVALLLCVTLTCLVGWWLARTVDAWRQPIIVVVTATATATFVPSATPTPSLTSTPTGTATPTATGTPTATPTATGTPTPTATGTPTPLPTFAAGANSVRLVVWSGPGLAFPTRLAPVAPGASVRTVGASSDGAWVELCCLPDGSTGWVPANYLILGNAFR